MHKEVKKLLDFQSIQNPKDLFVEANRKPIREESKRLQQSGECNNPGGAFQLAASRMWETANQKEYQDIARQAIDVTKYIFLQTFHLLLIHFQKSGTISSSHDNLS